MTASTAQPNFWDFYTTIFKKYVVKGAHVQIRATNQGPVSIYLAMVPLGDTVPGSLTTIQSVREVPRKWETMIPQAGS